MKGLRVDQCNFGPELENVSGELVEGLDRPLCVGVAQAGDDANTLPLDCSGHWRLPRPAALLPS